MNSKIHSCVHHFWCIIFMELPFFMKAAVTIDYLKQSLSLLFCFITVLLFAINCFMYTLQRTTALTVLLLCFFKSFHKCTWTQSEGLVNTAEENPWYKSESDQRVWIRWTVLCFFFIFVLKMSVKLSESQ